MHSLHPMNTHESACARAVSPGCVQGESAAGVEDATSAVLALVKERGGGVPHLATEAEVMTTLLAVLYSDCFPFAMRNVLLAVLYTPNKSLPP